MTGSLRVIVYVYVVYLRVSRDCATCSKNGRRKWHRNQLPKPQVANVFLLGCLWFYYCNLRVPGDCASAVKIASNKWHTNQFP